MDSMPKQTDRTSMKPSQGSTALVPVGTEIGQLYNRTLQAYSREPKDGEFDAWANVLGFASYADLDAALRRWANDTYIEEYTQRPRGSRMPSAAELKLSIDRFNAAHSHQFVPCNENGCEGGWIHVYEGQTIGGEGRGPNRVDPKVGAVKRCACFWQWAEQKKARRA
jgi:hypothetical protein